MLKINIIKNLDFELFLNFYDLSNVHLNKKQIYENIKIEDENIKTFWNEIFKNTNNIDNIFNKEQEKNDILFKGIPYLNKENFLKLKVKINFIQYDIFVIFKHFTQKYGFINFSNILDYINNKSNILKYYKLIIEAQTKHLYNNGIIIVNYSWNKIKM